jgi:simple sugar transport system permease protein
VKLNRVGLAIAAPALALVISLVVAMVVLLVSGSDLSEVWSLIVHKGFTLRSLLLTLNRAGPYYVAGVAVAVGFKMNLFNIGVEGQYRLGALLGAAAGAAITLPGPLHVVLILVVAMAVGAAWSLVAGVLRVTRGVSEVISTIMLNAIAFGLTAFMLTRWFQAAKTGTTDYTVGTKPIASSGHLPRLNHIVTGLGFDMPRGVQLESFIVIAALVGFFYWVLVWRTRLGFDLRASGLSPAAARASGVSARRMVLIAMGVSGAMAGLVGLSGILSEAPFRYTDDAVTAGLGFTGIAIALLGRNNPVGIAFGALLWAFMDVLRTPLAQADLPNEIVSILQATVVFAVVIAYEVVRRVAERREAAALAREGRGGLEPAPAGAPA